MLKCIYFKHAAIFFYLVLLASGSGGLNQLLQDSQAHQCDVFHHYWCLYVDRHEEQAEGYIWGMREGKKPKDTTLLVEDS